MSQGDQQHVEAQGRAFADSDCRCAQNRHSLGRQQPCRCDAAALRPSLCTTDAKRAVHTDEADI